jgi:hypothetical protein
MDLAQDKRNQMVPVPSWHDVDGEQKFGFWLSGSQGKSTFVEQLWKSEHQELRDEYLRRLGIGAHLDAEITRKYKEKIHSLPGCHIVRNRITGSIGWFHRYNTHGIGEFVCSYGDGSMDSEFIRDWIPVDGRWPDESF